MLFSMFRLQGDRTILFQMSDISLFDMFEPRSGDGVSTSVPLPYKEDGCAPPRKKWKVEPKENISCKFRHIFLHFQFLFSHVLYCIRGNELLCYQMMVIDWHMDNWAYLSKICLIKPVFGFWWHELCDTLLYKRVSISYSQPVILCSLLSNTCRSTFSIYSVC